MSIYSKHFNNKATPQTQPLNDSAQIQNNAGGYVFEASKWDRLNRFLLLGTEGGTYYTGEQKLTIENAKNVIECIKLDGVSVVDTIVHVSKEGRAPKNDPAIFALALATTYGDADTKRDAYNAITQVCRTSTHLFTFNEQVKALRGTSSGLKKGIAKFYTERTRDELAYQLIKYRQRNGWTHRDILRLAHPSSTDLNDIFRYAVGKATDLNDMPVQIEAFEVLQKLGKTDVKRSIELITTHKLPWEAIPTELLNDKRIWEALLPTLPLNALLRNLAKMTMIGLFDGGKLDSHTRLVREKFRNAEYIKKSRLHPMAILNALRIYEQGRGERGKNTWTPVSTITDALNDAFYLAFDNVIPTGKNILVGVDVSGSMNAPVVGMTGMTARQAAGAMACILANTEPNCELIGFNSGFVSEFRITPNMRLDQVMNILNRLSGGTDCSVPMNYATEKKLDVDAFVILSDNETWSGYNHPKQALNKYRKLKPEAKLIGIGMAANKFDITDPADTKSLSIAGFDTAIPTLITEFIRG